MKRVPIGLTVATALALAVLVGLGVWQLQRLAWKESLLARIAALQHALPRPLVAVLASANGASAEYAAVQVECAPAPGPAPQLFRYALRDGRIAWRLLSECRLAGGPYDAILLDRGLVDRLAGAVAPSAIAVSPPASVAGVLRAPSAASFFDPAAPTTSGGVTTVRVVDKAALTALARLAGLVRPAPYYLAVEREQPAPVGIEPAALPQAISNNHFVYALTWFGLGAVLVGVYIAMLAGRGRAP